MNTTNMTLFKTAGVNVKLRSKPAGDEIGALIKSGTTIQLSGKIEKAELDGVLYHWFELHSGGWFAYVPELSLILARPDPVPVPKPLPPPPVDVKPVHVALRGAHAAAGGWAATNIELDFIRHNQVKSVLIAAYERGQTHTIEAMRNAGVQDFIIRAAAHPGHITSDYMIWIQATLPRLRAYHEALRRIGKPMLIVPFNEPNLSIEGYGKVWFSGQEFSQWIRRVIEVYRRELPGALIGFPPLSPGGNLDLPHIKRSDEWVFSSECGDAIRQCDWLATHAYYLREDAQDFRLPIQQWKTLAQGRSVIITECGPADGTRVTRAGLRHMYHVCASAGVPTMAWILSGSGSWSNADWIKNNVWL